MLLRALLNQAEASYAGLVPWIQSPNIAEEAAIDLENDLQVTWQQQLDPRERPLFKRLRQQGVIGVGQGRLRQIPRLIPPEMRIVEQDPHQFRYRHCRMRVVQLDRDLVGKFAPIGIATAETPHQIG